jgi:hypothetical protein
MIDEWIPFDSRKPDRSLFIWIGDKYQVHIAYWSMERTFEYSLEPDPGIIWCRGWLGTDQPTHWCDAKRPAPPGSTSLKKEEGNG